MSCNAIELLNNWHNEKDLVTRILNQMEYPGQNLIAVLRIELWLSSFYKEDWQSLPIEFQEDLEYCLHDWLGELESQIEFYKTSDQTVMELSANLFDMLDQLSSRFNSTPILQPLKRILGYCLHRYWLSEIAFHNSLDGESIEELHQVDFSYYNECSALLNSTDDFNSLIKLGPRNWVVVLLSIKQGSLQWKAVESIMSEVKKEQEKREFLKEMESNAAYEEYLDAEIQAYCPYCENSPCECGTSR